MVERHVAHEGHIRVIWYRSRDHLNTEVLGCLKCQDLCVCSWTTQMHFQQLFPLSVSSINRAYQEIILRDALCLHDFSFLLHQSVHPLSSSLTVVRIYKMGSLAFLSFILLLLDFSLGIERSFHFRVKQISTYALVFVSLTVRACAQNPRSSEWLLVSFILRIRNLVAYRSSLFSEQTPVMPVVFARHICWSETSSHENAVRNDRDEL